MVIDSFLAVWVLFLALCVRVRTNLSRCVRVRAGLCVLFFNAGFCYVIDSFLFVLL